MGVDRIWHWTCDGCGAQEQRNDYGLPRGWVFVKGREITHRCPECAKVVPANLRGEPKVVAER
jgi:uncharacterized Zn finger protein